MKSVLISIQPKWVEKIASDKKTIEVRKSKPKLETPFKCYIYCTKDKNNTFFTEEVFDGEKGKYAIPSVGNGKVIGEFVCDKIEPLTEYELLYGMDEISNSRIEEYSCVDIDELLRYKGKNYLLYGWHITDLKIYDKPKDLSEFYIYDRDKHRPSVDCEHKKAGYSHDWCLQMEGHFCNECLCDKKRFTRPPQSWCYVEKE